MLTEELKYSLIMFVYSVLMIAVNSMAIQLLTEHESAKRSGIAYYTPKYDPKTDPKPDPIPTPYTYTNVSYLSNLIFFSLTMIINCIILLVSGYSIYINVMDMY